MDTLSKEAKRLIRRKDVLGQILDLIHRKGEDEEEEEGEATVEVEEDDGSKVTLRRLELP